MSHLQDVAHFMYGHGFWYANPEPEIRGLTEEQLLWVPGPWALPILWQVGHIAHRECTHLAHFLQGQADPGIPDSYNVFGSEWAPVDEVRRAMGSVDDVLRWAGEVRERSHAFIDTLTEEDLVSIPPTSDGELSVAHWLLITTNHTALHIGRIQLLRALIEGERERAC